MVMFFSLPLSVGMGLSQYVDFAFMHHPYLVCVRFGMPSLHLFTFVYFLFLCFLMVIPVTVRPKPEKTFFKCNYNFRT